MSNQGTRGDELRYDPETNTYYYQQDWSREAPSDAVTDVVARVLETDAKELEPLYTAIDPDGLDLVFEPRPGRRRRDSDVEVSFRFDGCTVTIARDGEIRVRPPDEERDET